MIDDDMRRVVDEQRLGYIATVCPDGTPNLSPKGTTAVWDDHHLVFAHVHSHGTVANIEAGNLGVEVNVVDPIRRHGYRFKGTASVYRDGPTFDAVRAFYKERGSSIVDRAEAFVLVRIERVARLVSPAYDDGTSEEEIAERSLAMYGLRRASP
jgi:uncharacterized protein